MKVMRENWLCFVMILLKKCVVVVDVCLRCFFIDVEMLSRIVLESGMFGVSLK